MDQALACGFMEYDPEENNGLLVNGNSLLLSKNNIDNQESIYNFVVNQDNGVLEYEPITIYNEITITNQEANEDINRCLLDSNLNNIPAVLFENLSDCEKRSCVDNFAEGQNSEFNQFHSEIQSNQLEDSAISDLIDTCDETMKIKRRLDETVTTNENLEEPQRERKKTSETKQRTISKIKRLKGKAYIGYKRDKENIITHDTPRNSRSIKERCNHKTPKTVRNKSFLCGSFSDEDRKNSFKKFWKLETWNEKKLLVSSLVENRPVRRRRKESVKNNAPLKKKEGHDYYLQNMQGQRVKVCRNFFLKTLNLGEDCLKRWIKRETPSANLESSSSTLENSPEIEKTKRKVSRLQVERQQLCETVNEWISLVPKVPSHYCRSSSNMVYVDYEFISKNNMYSIFKQWCTENNKKPVHLKLFKSILKQNKVSIHKPRKDQCDTCVAFKTGNISEQEYQTHRINKDAGRNAKIKAKNSASDEILVITMDLQSVLTCPKILASQSDYKLKLQVHNFTIYALNNKNVSLYVWHESNGGVVVMNSPYV